MINLQRNIILNLISNLLKKINNTEFNKQFVEENNPDFDKQFIEVYYLDFDKQFVEEKRRAMLIIAGND